MKKNMDKSLFLVLIKDKKGVLNRFLETISIISDKNFQKRIWIKGLGPECSDFVNVHGVCKKMTLN